MRQRKCAALTKSFIAASSGSVDSQYLLALLSKTAASGP
jgi:hypothetical protein